MSNKVITIVGGNGFVGQILQPGLRKFGYQLNIFDQLQGPLVYLLRHPYLATSKSPRLIGYAYTLRRSLGRLEQRLTTLGLLRPTWDNIMDFRSRLAERFRGSAAVIHLAALPHPKVRGAVEADYRRINYDAAVNVFEAAKQASVPKFIFASSGQVYGINRPVRIDQFPILESNYSPALTEGQSMYGFLKLEFEKYLAGACTDGNTQSISLRLECPGVLSDRPMNFYISTSIENTVSSFDCAIKSQLSSGYDVFNVADQYIDAKIVNIQDFIKTKWARVPNYTTGNDCLLSTEKARSLLGYTPRTNGTYYAMSAIW